MPGFTADRVNLRERVPMRTLMIFAIALGACAVAPDVETQSSAIRNGDVAPQLVKQVFAIIGANTHCSSSTVRYPRCMLTAAHCSDDKKATYFQGALISSESKEQSAAIWETHPSYVPVDPQHDLAIAWLENKLPGKTDRMQPGDYQPFLFTLPGQDFLGLEQHKLPSLDQPMDEWPRDPKDQWFGATAAGYGGDGHNHPFGGLRSGDVEAVGYYFSNVLVTQPKHHQIGCPGDSGGPLIEGGAQLGVLSLGSDGDCKKITRNAYTVFEPMTNFDWMDRTMEADCTQWLTVKIIGQGTVKGTIAPAQRFLLGVRNNDKIDCPGDCAENFHQATPSRAAQEMNITATPAAGWTFVSWKSDPKRKCQCGGSASCLVTQKAMGTYTQTDSIDEDVCIAEFVPESDGGGGDGGEDASGDASDAGTDADADDADSD